MPEVKIPAFAKINLRLEILGKRPDGYHELRTILQTITLHDELRLRHSKGAGISLHVDGNAALSNEPIEKNLVYRAVAAMRAEWKDGSGVEIELKKKIPAGRGLGGGSSDAAAAMLGYLRLVGKKIEMERLMHIGASLGADVAGRDRPRADRRRGCGGCARALGAGPPQAARHRPAVRVPTATARDPQLAAAQSRRHSTARPEREVM